MGSSKPHVSLCPSLAVSRQGALCRPEQKRNLQGKAGCIVRWCISPVEHTAVQIPWTGNPVCCLVVEEGRSFWVIGVWLCRSGVSDDRKTVVFVGLTNRFMNGRKQGPGLLILLCQVLLKRQSDWLRYSSEVLENRAKSTPQTLLQRVCHCFRT